MNHEPNDNSSSVVTLNPLTLPVTDKIAGALAKAHQKFKAVTKSRVANVGQYKYKFADLSDVVDCCRDALADNGLCFTQSVEGDLVITKLYHSSGQSLSNTVPLVSARGAGPQAFGSAFTYARRYGLCGLLGIVAEDDDDAQVAESDIKAGQGFDRLPFEKLTLKQPANVKPTEAQTHSSAEWELKPITEKQVIAIKTMWRKLGYSVEDFHRSIERDFGKKTSSELTQGEANKLLKVLTAEIGQRPNAEDA